jgi:hypothetical protein
MQTTQAESKAGASGIPLPVEIVGVRVPVGSAERRNPVVLVEVSFGEVRVTYAVLALKGRKITVRAPETPEGVGGVTLTERLAGFVGELVWAAAKNNPAAWSVLTRTPYVRRLAR